MDGGYIEVGAKGSLLTAEHGRTCHVDLHYEWRNWTLLQRLGPRTTGCIQPWLALVPDSSRTSR